MSWKTIAQVFPSPNSSLLGQGSLDMEYLATCAQHAKQNKNGNVNFIITKADEGYPARLRIAFNSPESDEYSQEYFRDETD